MYKMGLVSVSFRSLPAKDIIEHAKSAGLSCIEWGSDVHAPKDDIKRLEEIASLQRLYGIECSSYGTYFRLGITPIDELEEYISAAKVLKTDILRLWCGDKDSEKYSEKEREALFSECRAAARIAEERGVKLCMECHNWTYTNTRQSALQLMQAVSSPAFRMYWQPNQYKGKKENFRYAEELSEYTEHIHVFNWRGDNKYPLKDGVDIWQKYLRKLGKDKTLLLEFMPDGKIESLGVEAQALAEIVGGAV